VWKVDVPFVSLADIHTANKGVIMKEDRFVKDLQQIATEAVTKVIASAKKNHVEEIKAVERLGMIISTFAVLSGSRVKDE